MESMNCHQLLFANFALGLCLPLSPILHAVEPAAEVRLETEAPVTVIGAGSCSHANKPMPAWEAISAKDPRVFLHVGDNVYADTDDADKMRAAYEELFADAGYARLRQNTHLISVWDDHDYGINDGDRTWAFREMAEKVFHEVYATPADHPRLDRPGLYQSWLIGPSDGPLVKLIVLDTRYFKDPWKLSSEEDKETIGRYAPDDSPEKTLLGQAQWEWLAGELESPGHLTIIVSSFQVLPTEQRFEKWSLFPKQRQKLIELLKTSKVRNAIIVSGDRHLAEISVLPADESGLDFPLYELTASSLNAGMGPRWSSEPNRLREGQNFTHDNFGLIRVNWSEGPEKPAVTFEICDVKGGVQRAVTHQF